MRHTIIMALLVVAGIGCTQQPVAPASPKVVWESPKTSVPEIKLAVSIWPVAKQLTHPHDSLGRYSYSIDIGFPQVNDKELFRKFNQGLADLGWEPISSNTPNTKYQKGEMRLQVSFDTGRHPTTLMLSFEPAGKDTEPPAGGDGKPAPQP
jgi:hypothetical protein